MLGIFVTLTLVGAGIFATHSGGGAVGVGKVVVWGDVDQGRMDTALNNLKAADKSFSGVTYVYKNPSAYASDLIDAMASGKGPDLFLVTPESVSTLADKITPIPYSVFSAQAFSTAYVDEGNLFLTSTGPIALPILLDPLVMYWNRDMLAAAGVAEPPADWDTLLSIAPRLSQIDGNLVLQKSAVALGSWNNIAYAKEVLLSLVMQAGDPILAPGGINGQQVTLGATPPGATHV